MQKRAAVFDPYLDSIGGGEVYTATVIEFLLKNRFNVEIFWKSSEIIGKIKNYLGIDISQAKINSHGYQLFKEKGNIYKKIILTKRYSLLFFLSDGSIPWIFSKKNILHFQVPFQEVRGKSFLNQLKLKNIHNIVCNSGFTKNFIDKEFSVESQVIYPPINIHPHQLKKENIILSVGRFTQTLHNKRQDILVRAFRKMVNEGLVGWKLKLIGNDREGKDLVEKLKKKIKGYPISIVTNINHEQLEKEYSKARIFWHAAGFGVDENKHPEKVEHFGIATAEAISAGCVPVVINKGGQKEIVSNNKTGYLWNTESELITFTKSLIDKQEKLKRLSLKAKKKSKVFSKQVFFSSFADLTEDHEE